MPVTLTSAAASYACDVISGSLASVLGSVDSEGAVVKLYWDEYDKFFRGVAKKSYVRDNPHNLSCFLKSYRYEPINADADIIHSMARNAYIGGVNASFRIGAYFSSLYPDRYRKTFDVDQCNSYPTALACVPDIDWTNPIEYRLDRRDGEEVYLTPDMVPTPFTPAFAYATFEFPRSVLFPCLPMHVGDPVIYTRTSGSKEGVFLAGPELYLALQLGARIKAKNFYRCRVLKDSVSGEDSHCLFDVVKTLIESRNQAKKFFGKGSLPDYLLKIAINAIYGKIAQNVSPKMSWSARTEDMEEIGASKLTSPYHACMITSVVRALMLAAINDIQAFGGNYHTYSVTTDGYITDMPLDLLNGLDLFGFAPLLHDVRSNLVGNPAIWEIKHEQNDLLNITTRGNVSLETTGVCAHANGYKTDAISDSTRDRYLYTVNVLSRTGRLFYEDLQFKPFRYVACKSEREDFEVVRVEKHISMDFDMKRKPVKGSFEMVSVFVKGHSFVGDGVDGKGKQVGDFHKNFVYPDGTYEIANFDTEPFDSPDEYEMYKRVKDSCTVLRTMEDWGVFWDKVTSRDDNDKGSPRKIRDLPFRVLMSCVIAHRLGVPVAFMDNNRLEIPFLSSDKLSVSQKIGILNRFNDSPKRAFTEQDWKNARKQSRITQMLPSTNSEFHSKAITMIDWWEKEGKYEFGLEKKPAGED